MFKSSKKQLLMHSVKYGTKTIEFQLARASRKTLAIEVHPDSSVQLIAPEDSTLEAIKSKVAKRAKWIVKQQGYFEQFLPHIPIREYVSGETHFYLGKRYVLKVTQGDENKVKLTGGQLVVTLKNPSHSKVKTFLAAWYYNHAKKKFAAITDSVLLKFKEEQIKINSLEINRMKNRWGSCTPTGKIILNPELIKAPSKCIEYVIIHEICHLIIPKHNKAFYALLEEKFPDWKKWKLKLEQVMASVGL
jgi:predicted metal-dependent hydrolase